MKIEVWSDFVCPFCYIGKRRLEAALESVTYKDKVEVVFKSFELDPNAAVYDGTSIHEKIAQKYGMSVEKAKEMNSNLKEQAEAVGLKFEFESMKPTNTLDAHRLAKFAEIKGKEMVMTERLLAAYFTDSRLLSDHETLLAIAKESGLEGEEVEDVLKSNAFEDAVRRDEQEASSIGIQGVPFFVINRKYAISGAQPLEVFTNALNKVWEEENAAESLQNLGEEGAACKGDACDLPTNTK